MHIERVVGEHKLIVTCEEHLSFFPPILVLFVLSPGLERNNVHKFPRMKPFYRGCMQNMSFKTYPEDVLKMRKTKRGLLGQNA